jgi:hydrogenase maturation protein HypF
MRVRREIELEGRVQGVGLRPWAARRARGLGLAGCARNGPGGARLEIEGDEEAVARFLAALAREGPCGARVEAVRVRAAPCRGERAFAILPSEKPGGGARAGGARVPPDAALCSDCLRELFDPADRRHRYPFGHCAVCGPRASVLAALPWDRERTSLAAFPPCAACRREYDDPADRRHHAETLACPACGPRLAATDAGGAPLPGDALEAAAACLVRGGIAAVKGYGGFHLLADARSRDAVSRRRARKGRPTKPFALLVPDRAAAARLVVLSAADAPLLGPPIHAVVVAPRRDDGARALGLAPEVAPRTRDLGVVLPYAPVHWLLLFAPGARPDRDPPRLPALVFTSANRSEEPTLHDDVEARRALAGIADLVVGHDRAVARPSDDPVFRSARGGPIPIRLSRSTSPRAVALPAGLRAPVPVAAVGGDLKAAPALAVGGEICLAEHVGDLASAAAADALLARAADLFRLLGAAPALAAHDSHPDALGRALAAQLAPRRLAVQHHHAHAAACLVENARAGPALALTLDGAGHGDDGSVWGGELLRVELARCERLASLERVPLPGGDAATRAPWRMAAVWLARAFPGGAPRLPWHERRDPRALALVLAAAARGVASPPTSSCGRLFDAVASLLDQGDEVTHEAEAAIALESLAATERNRRCGAPSRASRGFAQAAAGACRERAPDGEIPVADLVREVARGRAAGANPAALARRFHRALAGRLASATAAWSRALGLSEVALSGGCLQNRILLEDLTEALEARGLAVLRHRRLPPNDGALAVGQAAVAVARLATG